MLAATTYSLQQFSLCAARTTQNAAAYPSKLWSNKQFTQIKEPAVRTRKWEDRKALAAYAN
jgi:hypothetical protein